MPKYKIISRCKLFFSPVFITVFHMSDLNYAIMPHIVLGITLQINRSIKNRGRYFAKKCINYARLKDNSAPSKNLQSLKLLVRVIGWLPDFYFKNLLISD